MPLDSEVGGASANSYASVADADAYFSESFGKGLWTGSTDKEALLITASRSLDQYMSWDGVKSDDAQTMEWPRIGAFDKTGKMYAGDAIPMPVKFATYELAYYMLQNGGLSFQEQSVDQVKVGSVAVKFTDMSVDSGIPTYVEALVAHIGSTELPSANSVRSVPLERV